MAEGRSFDVAIEHQALQDQRPLEEGVAAAVYRAVSEDPQGHVLVFLPGVGEIERTARQLASGLPSSTQVLPLHGRLKAAAQDAALKPCDHQKVVLATNIAETSLTLDGVTSVVDSGLVRRPRFDPRIGLDRLETVNHSQASATQRAGRAGRTRSGRCIRLWTSQAQSLRLPHDPPAVVRTDLAATVLQLYAWGARPQEFLWFERPAESAIETAEGLLMRLGALTESEPRSLTPLGTQLAQLPVRPRLGRVIVAGKALGVLESAAAAAALSSERDPWRDYEGSADLMLRLEWLRQGRRKGVDPRAHQAVLRVTEQLIRLGRKLDVAREESNRDADARVVQALIAGFPDRVGLRREKGARQLLLSGGQGVELAPGLRCGDCVVAVTLTAGARGRTPWVRVVAEVDPEHLSASWVDEAVFDRERQAVSERQALRFGALVLKSRSLPHGTNPERVSQVLVQAAQGAVETLFSFSAEDGRVPRRLLFARSVRPDVDWPAWIDEPASLLPEWCEGRRSFEQIMQLDVSADFLARLTWPQRQMLDTVAPDRMKLPSGSTAQVQYPEGQPPVLAARIQQLFGMMETPVLGGVTLTVHLLAPNRRPAQITQDLAGFWSGSYADVRKDLRGRYPRHAWPEDPSQAIPEDRPKRRR